MSSTRSKTVFAIVDCNNFYASCERLFRPELIGKPVVVLSNNDGCIIARSNEAKALGVEMGAAYFKVHKYLKQANIAVFSSNYALYGDMSRRVMDVLSHFTPNMEVYSIDEAFLDLSGFEHVGLNDYAKTIKYRTEKWTGIPVSVGVGSTKTLAKVANRVSKKEVEHQGTLDLTSHPDIDAVLASLDVGDIWGVGRRWSQRLKADGIYTALDLRDADLSLVQSRYNVVLARTVRELRGESCIPLDEVPPVRQQILCSRSFGVKVTELKKMRQAMTHFTTRAAEKLRGQQLLASAVNVHISTSPYDKQQRYYNNGATQQLITQTDDTCQLLDVAQRLLLSVYAEGYRYQRAGIVLMGLVPRGVEQRDLFAEAKSDQSSALMNTVDLINQKMGKGVMRFAGESYGGDWRMNQNLKSPSYTTRLDELYKVGN